MIADGSIPLLHTLFPSGVPLFLILHFICIIVTLPCVYSAPLYMRIHIPLSLLT
jgi:hypothetical protein